MKKSLAFIIFAVCIFSLVACNNTTGIIGGADGPVTVLVGEISSNTQNGMSSYINEAIALTKEAAIPAKDEIFVQNYAVKGEMYDIMKAIADADFSKPSAIKLVSVDKTATLEKTGSDANSELYLLMKFDKFSLQSFAVSHNASFGANTVAATSVLTNSTGYVKPDDFKGEFALVLEYPGEFSSMVSFTEKGDAVIAQSIFIKNGDISKVFSDADVVFSITEVK